MIDRLKLNFKNASSELNTAADTSKLFMVYRGGSHLASDVTKMVWLKVKVV